MADFVNPTTLDIVLSQHAMAAPWTTIDRPSALAAQAIPRVYRKWTGSSVAQMNAAERGAADAVVQSANDDEEMTRFDRRSIDGVQFRLLFKLHNRVRVLEGASQHTAAQFKSALRAELEGI